MTSSNSVTVLANHLGYTTEGSAAVVLNAAEPVKIVSATLISETNRTSIDFETPVWEYVRGWSTGCYARLQLPTLKPSGTYKVEVVTVGGVASSRQFTIGADRIQQQSISDLLSYFRASRSFGEIDRKDTHAKFYNDDSGVEIDAHGGWLDASGDFSKFLSHLTYTRMMSPQQIPLCAWAFAAARDELEKRHPELATHLGARLRDESLFGADFLVRFQAPEGYFYTAVFDALTKNLEERVINAPLQNSVRTQRWQAAYRHGGGMAIAALARASTLESDGAESTRADYLNAATRGFLHLEKHNTEYSFDGTESVIDDYCALMAATELLNALKTASESPDSEARTPLIAAVERAAIKRAANLAGRWRTDGDGIGYLAGDVDGVPFFHAAETGLPVIALLRWAQISDSAHEISSAQNLASELMLATVTRVDGTENPFGYFRQFTQGLNQEPRNTFFDPHENETGYWWQGENANISSISYAASLVAELPSTTAKQAERLRRLGDDLVHWVTGLNPFDTSMLQGRGFNNAEYSTAFQNVPGGILNGITSGFDDENDISFLPTEPAKQGNSWRWAEQWIPHSAWYLLAVSAVR